MVTVIIPTYKRADNIKKTIQSVLNQTYQNFEIIVVDDNNENSQYRQQMEKIMDQYKDNPKIKYLKHKENKNGAAARNTGIKEAKGDYITFLDDDDYYMPKRLEILVNALDKNKQYNGAYTATVISKKGNIIGKTDAKKSGNFKKELLLNKFSIGTGSNMFFRANTLKEMNGFNEKFLRHQDIECMIRFFRNNEIMGINDILVIKSQNDRSNEPNYEKVKEIKKVYIDSFKNDINELEENDQKEFYAINIGALISIAIKCKKYNEAKLLKQELKQYKTKTKIISKRKIRNLLSYINNYINIGFIEEVIRRKIYTRSVNKEVIKIIKENNI